METEKPPIIPNDCYDFPLAVIHTPKCPRYHGGVCHPLPTPIEPMTDEERGATETYNEIVRLSSNQRRINPAEVIAKMGNRGEMVKPTGTTGAVRKVPVQ